MKVEISIDGDSQAVSGFELALCPYATDANANAIRTVQPTFYTILRNMAGGKAINGNAYGSNHQTLSYYASAREIIGGKYNKYDANYSGYYNSPPIYPFGFLGQIRGATSTDTTTFAGHVLVTHYVTCYDRNLSTILQ